MLFGFKKKVEVVDVYAPVSGKMIALSESEDAVFSTGAMGEGVAVEPSDEKIVSPFSGEITVIAETKHAIGMVTKDGLEVLLHLGIDTVELGGKPFKIFVNVGDKVKVGEQIASMNIGAINNARLMPTVMLVITNSNDKVETLCIDMKNCTAGEFVGTIKLKS